MILTLLKTLHYLFAMLTIWYICEGIYFIYKMEIDEAKGSFSMVLMSLLGIIVSGAMVN